MMPNASRALAGTLCLALALPGLPAAAQPIGLPTMGAASTDLSPAQERQLGEAIMAQGRRDPAYIDDPEVGQYLTSMGRRLAAHSPAPLPKIEMFGVLDPEINAFTLPGGFIGVNSGLFVSCESESELASVLGHELGHVAQRHIAQGVTQQGQNMAVALGSLAAALLAGLAGGGANLAMGIAAFGQAAAVSRQLGFSRDAEREADRAGLEMLYKAGYDSTAMARMFGRLMNASRLNEGAGGGAWASTHPLSIERMSDVENRIRELPPVHYVDSVDFWFLRAKLRVVQSRDSQALVSVREQLETEAASSQGVRRAAALYGLAVYWLRREDLKQASSFSAQAAASLPQGAPELARLDIMIALGRKDAASAVQLGAAAIKRWPEQRALGMAYAMALQNSGRDADAQAYLRERVKQWGEDQPDLYQMLAKSEDATGHPIDARRDMAQFYVLTDAYAAAESQLQQARRMSADFYEQSQFDAQIRDVRQKLKDERDMLEKFKS